ncbi:MAG: hypothetical protein C5B60_04695 [Chloroflexi bacterium]|nr:MAG: hypothetical protein C5B60_04695 [Chloroflexota bacterium]
MGADIYLKSKHEPHQALWEPRFNKAVRERDALPRDCYAYTQKQLEVGTIYDEMFSVGYYRDSYNNSSLLNQLNLSWWEDVGPMLDKNGMLPIERAKELRAIIAVRPLDEKRVREAMSGSETYDECLDYFEDKRTRLLTLLDESIELGEPLYMSI